MGKGGKVREGENKRERLGEGEAAELSMGPFCVTQPNPLQVTKFGPNPTHPNTYCWWLTLSLYYSF